MMTHDIVCWYHIPYVIHSSCITRTYLHSGRKYKERYDTNLKYLKLLTFPSTAERYVTFVCTRRREMLRNIYTWCKIPKIKKKTHTHRQAGGQVPNNSNRPHSILVVQGSNAQRKHHVMQARSELPAEKIR